MKTYNQIVSALSSIAAAHLQIKQFGNGDEWELVLNAQTYQQYQYPILWAVDVPAQVDEKVVTTKFRLIVADVVKRGEGNENEVKSDCFQIALDVMAQLYDIKQTQNYVWEIQRSTQLIPFTEKYDDYLTGWAFEISLNQLYNWSSCAVPSGIPTGISPEYVTIYDTDGVTVLATIAPGGAYTVTGGGGPCADAIVENTNATYTDSVPSGDTLILPDETVIVTDENDVVLQTITFPVYDPQNIDISTYCGDGVATLENTDGTVLSTTNVPSGGSAVIVAPDGTVNVQKSDGTPIASVTVGSGDTEPYQVADSSVTVNGAAFDTVRATESINIEVRKEAGSDLIGSKQGQFWRIPDSVITLKDTANNTLSTTNVPATEADNIVAPDGTVENSDASYTDTVVSGGTLVLPDTDIEVNGVNEGTIPSVSTADIQVTDGVSSVTPTSVVVSGNTVTIELPAASAPVGATLMKTGQTTSYRTGDDGDIEAGRATDFFTLASNNPFGNTDRFTEELGGQTYTNDIVIDWSTFDGSTVLGWDRVSSGATTANWNNSIDNALAVSIGTFTTGWRLANITEMLSICNFATSRLITYSPINGVNSNVNYWTSTTNPGGTSQAFRFENYSLGSSSSKTGSNRWYAVRTFTWNGSALT